MRKIFDATGREIHIGDRVRYATWGMLDVFVKDKQNAGLKNTDPKYVTHTRVGTVEKLFDENGAIHIMPDWINGVIRLCTRPSWNARPEFVEVIEESAK